MTLTKTARVFSTIRSLLMIGFGIIFLIFVTTVSINLMQNGKTTVFADQLIRQDIPEIESLNDLVIKIRSASIAFLSYMNTHNNTFLEDRKAAWENIHQLQKTLNTISTRWTNQEDIKKWHEINTLLVQWQTTQDEVVQTIKNAKTGDSASKRFQTELLPKMSKIIDILLGEKNSTGERVGGLISKKIEELKQNDLALTTQLQRTKQSQWFLLTLGIIITTIASFWISRRIATPISHAILFSKQIAMGKRKLSKPHSYLHEASELFIAMDKMQHAIFDNEDKLQKSEEKIKNLLDQLIKDINYFNHHISKVAAGNLTSRLTIPETSELGQLGEHLNHMTDSLANIAKQITQSSQQMAVSLDEVNRAVSSQTSGATEQATAINEITSTLGELESSSTQNLDKVSELGKSAQKTDQATQQGLESIQKSIEGMQNIRGKVKIIADTILNLSQLTQQVGEITAAVSDLAKQSKMLSLNASIEAAKAGEAGKGFSVVAEEVRNLAEQSEHATKQVQKILDDIRAATEKSVMATEEGSKEVDIGVKATEKIGDVMQSLRQVIHETTMACQQIVAAVRQESVGIKQINTGMDEINQVTNSFVASSKQTNEAISNLLTIAKKLKDQVDIYQVGE